MAPRKKADETKTKPLPKPATRTSTRLTRSSAKRLNARLTELSTDSAKKRKQGKAEESKTKEKKVKTAAETATATATATSTEAQVEVNNEDEKEEKDEADEDGDGDEVKEQDVKGKITSTGDGANKTIVIEHCKQCNAFKTRAMQVKDGLLSAFPGISVLLNPEKPRRGCFEIREEGGVMFISLLNMKRPFPPLKALDMDQVISDIIVRVKSSTSASG